jgi:hypothetical protein
MDYLMLLWLTWDLPRFRLGLYFKDRLRFKEENYHLNELQVPESNPIIETAEFLVQQGKVGWTPPDINIELPRGTRIFMSRNNDGDDFTKGRKNNKGVDLNVGQLTSRNAYFDIKIAYYVGWRASVGAFWAGPAPSVLGMPVNPFFQEYLLTNFSSIPVMSYYLVFKAKFNGWRLLTRPRTFYRYMQWAEHLSELFLRFFDWDENTKLALASRQGEIYQIAKGLELRLDDLERKLGEIKGSASSKR